MFRNLLLFFPSLIFTSFSFAGAGNEAFYFTSQPRTVAVWKDSVLISWSTSLSSVGIILLDEEIKSVFHRPLATSRFDANMQTGHLSVVKNLSPGHIYNLKICAFHGSDTAQSETKVIATQSNSSGKFTIYFTSPVDTTVSTGTNAIYLNNLVDDTLVQYINRSQYSLDIAIYNTTNSTSVANIAGAINSAYSRGVRVRVIYDGSSTNTMIPNLNPAINRVASPQGAPYTIMHNKFVVIDANSPNRSYVWTGSTNWTVNQVNGTDKNNVIIVQDQSLAQAYKLEFQEMWGDTGLVPNPSLARFGPFKLDNTPHIFNIGGKTVECYFSPSDSVNTHLINTINTCNTDMEFASMVITRSDVAGAITSKVSSGIFPVYGITDDSVLTTQWSALKTGMLPHTLVSHTGQVGIMHHKYLIVDQSNPASDPILLTGSHNWSTGANAQNDENTLIIHDATVANIYYQNFIYLFNQHGGIMSAEELNGENKFLVYPNPAHEWLTISAPAEAMRQKTEVKIFDLAGLEIRSWRLEAGENRIAISGVAKGIYILQFMYGSRSVAKKLVIE